jgi:hypothetical protein
MFSASQPYLICFLLTGALVLDGFFIFSLASYAYVYVYT